MKKRLTRAGVVVLFAAVIIISVAALFTPGDDDLQTVNTVSDTSSLTDAPLQEETDEPDVISTAPSRHDIDRDEAALLSSYLAAMTADDADEQDDLSQQEDYDEAEDHDEPEQTAPPETTVSRTVITSRQRKEYDSNSVYIDIANILQTPELPTGCEITALTILLRYWGFDAEKTDMARNYLPTSWGNPQTIDGVFYKDSFYDYFIGDPFSTGYGCFSPAIETAANSYISSHGGGFTVKNISGCSPDTLYEYLIDGIPVLCWATDGMIEPEYYETWYDNATGERLDWYLNEHCFVLAGFDISAGTVTLNDPMKGIIDYNIDKFETRFQQMHSQAIVIIPDNPVTDTVTEASSAAETAPAYEESDDSETVTTVPATALTEVPETVYSQDTAAEFISPWSTDGGDMTLAAENAVTDAEDMSSESADISEGSVPAFSDVTYTFG